MIDTKDWSTVPHELATFDVLLVGQTVFKKVMSRWNASLRHMHFWRVVVDESQDVKSNRNALGRALRRLAVVRPRRCVCM